MTNLQPTYGNFQVRGKIVGLEKENAYREGTTVDGKEYRSIRFGVKTSEENVVYVELFGMERDEVTIAHKDDNKNRKQIHWAERFEDLPEGYRLFMPVTVGLDKRKDLTEYDAVEYIRKNFKDGDSVFIRGSMNYREWKEETQVTHSIRSIWKSKKEIDFEDEKFEETNDFEQEIIFVGKEYDKENDKLYISTYIVTNKNGDFLPYNFTIYPNKTVKSSSGKESKLEKLAKKLAKFKFGTTIKVAGRIQNRVETVEIEVEEDDEWGVTPPSLRAATKIISELEIQRAFPETLIEKRYKEEDFIKPVEEEDDNPFANDDGDDEWGASDRGVDIGDDDLPF
jgi:hypothetical protein